MTTRTALFSRHQPGGVFVIDDYGEHPGAVFFVHSGTGTDGAGYGRNPDAPVATLDYAIGLCTASKGDVIYVMPGHAENLTAATSVNCDVAGVTIIGLGRATLAPTFTATSVDGGVTIGAANVALRNIRMVAGTTGGNTAAINITAAGDGFLLDGIHFRDTTNDKEWLLHVAIATTVTDGVIRNCNMVGLVGGSMTNSILFAGTSQDVIIEDSYFFVDSSDDVIDHLTGAAVNLVVRNCVVINSDTDTAGYCLRYKSDGTGVAYNNDFAYAKVDAEISVGAAAWWIQNFATNTIAESGRLDPTTSHAIP